MRHHTKEQLIEAEDRIADLWRDGEIDSIFHLSGGNEDQLLRIFEWMGEDDWVFATHRAHYEFLLKGGAADELVEHVLEGRSMFLFSRRLNFFTSSILGGICGIATGVALAIKLANGNDRAHVFLGDGAMDNGHAYEAIRYAESMDLPITFHVFDNGMAAESSKEARGATAWILNSTKVSRLSYTMTRQHCQAPSDKKITFKRKVLVG